MTVTFFTVVDELQKHLAITQNLLAEVVTDYSEENSKAFSLLKELKELSLKMDEELQRYVDKLTKKIPQFYNEFWNLGSVQLENL